MVTELTPQELLESLARLAYEAGSQRQLARQLQISPAYLCDVLQGRRDISATLATKLGYTKQTIYVKEPHTSKCYTQTDR